MNSESSVVHELYKFVKDSFDHFFTHECLKSAAALSFTTILSIVPIIALLLFSLSQFFSDANNQLAIQNTLLNFFSPTTEQQLQNTLLELANHASQLRTFGLLVLVITVLLGLNTIDLTINNIWNIKRCKRTLVKLTLYFLVLMAIPVLVGISLSVSTYVLSISIMGQTLNETIINWIVIHIGPVIVSWVAFVCIYLWIPNTQVDKKSALVGGLIAAILFEASKILFIAYIKHFPTYDLIYGAFAVLPLFFLWIYISWVIILIGAVFTFKLMELKKLAEVKIEMNNMDSQ